MRWVMAAVVVGLMGCAQNPSEVREAGPVKSFVLKGPYRSAAACVQPVSEDAGMLTSAIADEDRRRVEVISKVGSLPPMQPRTVWIVDVMDAQSKTTGELYFNRYGGERQYNSVLELLKPCLP